MSPPLLWINKTPSSTVLSRSSRRDESRIRHHVQTRWEANNATAPSLVPSPMPSDCGLKQVGQATQQQSLVTQAPSENSVRPSSRIRESSTLPFKRRHGSSISKQKQIYPTVRVPQTIVGAWQELCHAERRSLAFFELYTSQQWSGWQDVIFWGRLAMQASQQSTAVAHSLVSLSALHESLNTPDGSQKRTLQRLGFASIQMSVESLIGSNLSYFEALVSCLALLCFQNLQQSRNSFLLLQSGLNMLREYDDKTSSPKRRAVSVEEGNAIETWIRPLFSRLCCRPCRMGDPSTAFLISVKRQRIKDRMQSDRAKPTIPASFVTLIEAKDSLIRVLEWAHSRIPIDRASSRVQQSFEKSLRLLQDAWNSALSSSLLNGPVDEASNTNRSKALLHVSCIFAMIMIKTAGTKKEITYDRYLPEFRRIMQLLDETNTSHSSLSNDISFGIDSGLVDIVTFVGTKCRDPIVRRQALNLLLLGNRIEGDRLASIPGEILRVQIELEESDVDVRSCNDVPESHRRRLLRGHQVFATRQIELFFTATPYDPNLGALEERHSVSLPGPIEEDTPGDYQPNRPDAIFGSGYARFLEDRETGKYFGLDIEQFFFPIPRS